MSEIRKELMKPVEALTAFVLSGGSAASMGVSERFNFTVNHKDPSHIRRRWWWAGNLNKYEPRPQWLIFNQDDYATSILPKNFKLSGIIQIDREIMDSKLELHGETARPAMAYALGENIMAGFTQDEDILYLADEDDEYYQIAMGIGKKPLVAGAGVVYFEGRHKLYDPMNEGLVQGEIVPKIILPTRMPRI